MRPSHGRLAPGLALLVSAGFLGWASPALATDCGSLQIALTNAQAGDTVTLDAGSVCAGPFTLPNASITLQGGGAGATIQGAVGARAMSGVDVGATHITNLTFRDGGGSGGGGAIMVTGKSAPTFSDVKFLANLTAGGPGGALYINTVATSGNVTLDRVTFGDGSPGNANHSSHGGGALAVTSAIDVAITDTLFLKNATDDVGGGGAMLNLSAGADATITSTTFDSNGVSGFAAGLGGGGLRISPTSGSLVTIKDSSLHQNTVSAGPTATSASGAGLQVGFTGTTDLPSVVLSGNSFDGNSITGGSSIAFDPRGGGMSVIGAGVTSRRDRFVNNRLAAGSNTPAKGAGIAISTCPTAGIVESLLEQDAIAGNSSPGPTAGAGVYATCDGLLAPISRLRMRFSTVSGNSTVGGVGGLLGGVNDIVTIEGSIVTANSSGLDFFGFGTQDVTFSDVCVNGQPVIAAGNICAEPRLMDAAAGDIRETVSSPTLERGNNAQATGLSTDNAGTTRVVDADSDGTATVDIGASERPVAVTCDRLNSDFANSVAGSVIRVAEGSTCTGSYTLPSRPVTLAGSGSGATFTPAVPGRSLYGTDSGATVLRNLTFTGGTGSPGGAVLFEGDSSPTIDHSRFIGNSSASTGGAIDISSTSSSGLIWINDSDFGDGTVPGENSALQGGAVAIHPAAAGVYVASNRFDGNRAKAGQGGALALDSGSGPTTVSGNRFASNVAVAVGASDGRGGGAYISETDPVHPLYVQGNQFIDNQIAGITGNLAGAGLYVSGSVKAQVSQYNNRFRGNSIEDAPGASSMLGAAEAISAAALTSMSDRFVLNALGAHGAARAAGAAVALNGCSFGTTTLHRFDNAAVAANRIEGDGAGAGIAVDCSSSLAVRVSNSTVTANSSAGTAGVFGGPGVTVTIANTILTANTGGADLSGFGSRVIVSSDVCDGAGPYAGPGNICASPLLVDVAVGDVHQLRKSPTVDAGSNAAVASGLNADYDGHERVIDGNDDAIAIVDIGASEIDQVGHPSPPVVIIKETSGPGPRTVQTPVQEATSPAADAPPSSQIVAGTRTTATPKKVKKCGDKSGPTSRFLSRLSKSATFTKGGLLVRGVASYKKCKGGDKGKIKRVNFTIKRVEGTRCSFLSKKGTFGPLTSCKKRVGLVRAKGTTRWSYSIRGPLSPGKYLAQVQAVDNLGNKERASAHRNFRHFRVSGFQLQQGWSGTHPDDYTKRG